MRLDIAYNGAGFAGWAKQPGSRTVQGELEEGLGRILGGPVPLAVAGRTDAGVHAWAQVASFVLDSDPPEELGRALNSVTGPDLAILGVQRAANGFEVAAVQRFRDHHPFSAADGARLIREARAAGARAIVTTEKDYVRLLPHRPFAVPLGYLPLTMDVEPQDAFRRWLFESVAAARDIILG